MTRQAQTAKAIREEIKKAFPYLKTRITSQSGSMTDSVRVVYLIDDSTLAHPVSEKDIENITNKYEMGHFDGMEDIYNYDNKREDIPQVNYIFIESEMTPSVFTRILRAFNAYWNFNCEAGISDSWNFKGEQRAYLNTYECDQSRLFRNFLTEKYNF